MKGHVSTESTDCQILADFDIADTGFEHKDISMIFHWAEAMLSGWIIVQSYNKKNIFDVPKYLYSTNVKLSIAVTMPSKYRLLHE